MLPILVSINKILYLIFQKIILVIQRNNIGKFLLVIDNKKYFIRA